MGNRGSVRRNQKDRDPDPDPDPPQITVIRASPRSARGPVFVLPEPGPGLSPTGDEDLCSQAGDRVGDPDGVSEGGVSPRASKRLFLEVMMDRSPQVRRSLLHRDPDSVSLLSFTSDEYRTPVTLDPLEHEWMLCASDGQWDSLYRLLVAEPGLILKKDFVTGFTCLHWAAKHGRPDLLAQIVHFAQQNSVPVSVDVRSTAGYTPLHVAAMQNQVEVLKLLVGAFSADVDIRDYSGRRACQYLDRDVTDDIRDMTGACRRSGSDLSPRRVRDRSGDCVDTEERVRENPVRRRSSLNRMRPKLQRFRTRTSQVIHSTTFLGSEDLLDSLRGPFKSRPVSHLFRTDHHQSPTHHLEL